MGKLLPFNKLPAIHKSSAFDPTCVPTWIDEEIENSDCIAFYDKLHVRARAQALVVRAGLMLSQLEGDDRRVAWLLEDCVQLLSPSERALL